MQIHYARDFVQYRGYTKQFRKEVEILVKLGVLEEANDYELGALYSSQSKAKTNRVILLSDFCRFK